ncbi:MAG: CPBP family intramembrane glutamic endopeptidase [Phycisphaerales bacterium]
MAEVIAGGSTYRRPLVWYFAALTVVTLLAGLPWVLASRGVIDPAFESALSVAVFAPSLSGLVAALAAGGRPGLRALLRSLMRWRFGWRWWAICLVATPAFVGAGGVAAWAVGLAPDGAFDWRKLALLPAVMLGTILTGGGLTEELGWRGFLLPRLLERGWSARRATVVVGVAWWAWHAPALGAGGPAWLALAFVGIGLPLTVLLSFPLSLAWLATGRSTLAPVLMHGAINGSAITIAMGFGDLETPGMAAFLLGAVAFGTLPAGALALAMWGRAQQRKTPHQTGGASFD